MGEAPQNEKAKGPPWLRPDIQSLIEWRDSDIVISVPPKSGTTWMMNIVHQLLNGGTDQFRDVYEEVPWIEFLGDPHDTIEQVADRINAMPRSKRRAFKTHAAPPCLPYFAPNAQHDVRYIVVARNPEEALVSFWPFFARHCDEWVDLWGMPRNALRRDTFQSFYDELVVPFGLHVRPYFDFVDAWWRLRQNANVLFLHFAQLKRDREGSIRQVADFLDIAPGPKQWSRIFEYTSFAWMKQHEDKFEVTSAGAVPVLERGAMLRKGQTGSAHQDGMTDPIAQELRDLSRTMNPDARAWLYTGNPPA